MANGSWAARDPVASACWPYGHDCAAQHAQFGVKRSHFFAFGDALIWALEQQFGPAFTPELKQAWVTLYDAVQREMIRTGQI